MRQHIPAIQSNLSVKATHMSAISNAILLIQAAVEHQGDGVNFTALNQDTGIPQGSAHRIVKELVDLRILDYDPVRKTYRGGLKLASLGAQVLSHYDIRTTARQSLETLHRQLGSVVTLGIRNGTNGIYLDKIESDDMGLRLHSEIGKTFPLHCTAMGKVLLAFADEGVQAKVWKKKLPALTPNTITDAAALRQALIEVKQNGYAIDNEEITRGLICTAAPIFGLEGSIVGALSFTCQKYIYEEQGPDKIIAKTIKAAESASA